MANLIVAICVVILTIVVVLILIPVIYDVWCNMMQDIKSNR